MKRLTLVRHGKAASHAGFETDFERPLTDSGVQEVDRVAARLAAAGAAPQRLLTSPAPRARTTAERMARALEIEPMAVLPLAELYLAEPAALLAVIAAQPPELEHLMLVGHNPGLTELVRRLASVRLDELPTAAVAGLELADWRALGEDDGRLIYFDYPLRQP